MNSLGWSRREPEYTANTNAQTPILSTLSSLNPFKRGGYVQLPTHEAPGAPLPAPSRREEEEGWFACEFRTRRSTKTTVRVGRDLLRTSSYILTSFFVQ